MTYPSQIQSLIDILVSLPGITNVAAEYTPLADIEIDNLSLLPYGDLPHATIRRSNGGLQAEALGQIMIELDHSKASWLTVEFLSWCVRDNSRAGSLIQMRSIALPPVIDRSVQLGGTLRFVIEFFTEGLDKDPEKLLREIEEFGSDLQSSIDINDLSWDDNSVSTSQAMS